MKKKAFSQEEWRRIIEASGEVDAETLRIIAFHLARMRMEGDLFDLVLRGLVTVRLDEGDNELLFRLSKKGIQIGDQLNAEAETHSNDSMPGLPS